MAVSPCATSQQHDVVGHDAHQPPVSPSNQPHKLPRKGRNTRRKLRRRQRDRCAAGLVGRRQCRTRLFCRFRGDRQLAGLGRNVLTGERGSAVKKFNDYWL